MKRADVGGARAETVGTLPPAHAAAGAAEDVPVLMAAMGGPPAGRSRDGAERGGGGGTGRKGLRRLLLVEDDAAVREGLSELLSSRYEVATAADFDDGLHAARTERPDLVLSDRFLPGGDGLALIEALGRDPLTEGTPVILLTADPDEATLERCFALGAADFARKPVSARELVARIERALRTSDQRRMLQALAQTDALTGLANFRALSHRLEEEFKRAQRYQHPLAVVVIDLDHLKALNDGLGHEVGNRAIFALAAHLRSNLRDVDFAARFGGDEFVALLPHQTAAEAAVFAERVRTALRGVTVSRPDGRPAPFGLTISVGVASHTPERPHAGPEALLAAADEALYAAKRGGRDAVVVHGGAAPAEAELDGTH